MHALANMHVRARTHACMHTHTHTRTHCTHTLIPFEECEPMQLIVNVAKNKSTLKHCLCWPSITRVSSKLKIKSTEPFKRYPQFESLNWSLTWAGHSAPFNKSQDRKKTQVGGWGAYLSWAGVKTQGWRGSILRNCCRSVLWGRSETGDEQHYQVRHFTLQSLHSSLHDDNCPHHNYETKQKAHSNAETVFFNLSEMWQRFLLQFLWYVLCDGQARGSIYACPQTTKLHHRESSVFFPVASNINILNNLTLSVLVHAQLFWHFHNPPNYTHGRPVYNYSLIQSLIPLYSCSSLISP